MPQHDSIKQSVESITKSVQALVDDAFVSGYAEGVKATGTRTEAEVDAAYDRGYADGACIAVETLKAAKSKAYEEGRQREREEAENGKTYTKGYFGLALGGDEYLRRVLNTGC